MSLPARVDGLLEKSVVGSFTNVGYSLRKSEWEELESDILSGSTAVVTGATSGLGRVAAQELGSLGADLRLVGRSSEKLDRVSREITSTTGRNVEWFAADLSSVSETKAVAEAVAGKRTDILINNAGALFTERRITSEGFEATFALNLLSPFILTNTLLPVLQASAPSRIVTVSSGGMYTQRIRVRDLNSERGEYRGSIAYARAKRGQVILTEMWAERLQGTGVVAHAMHPGWADTPGVQKSLPIFRRITGPFLRTPEQGADTIVWLAAADIPGRSNGQFWMDRSVRPTHRMKSTVEREADREALWEALNAAAGTDFA